MAGSRHVWVKGPLFGSHIHTHKDLLGSPKYVQSGSSGPFFRVLADHVTYFLGFRYAP